MHPEFTKSLLGWVGAGLSGVGSVLAQMLPKELESYGQGSALLLLIGCLIYAVKHQNGEAREERTKREADAKAWGTKWEAEHNANLQAREQDRDTRDKLAEAVKELAQAVKK